MYSWAQARVQAQGGACQGLDRSRARNPHVHSSSWDPAESAHPAQQLSLTNSTYAYNPRTGVLKIGATSAALGIQNLCVSGLSK